MIPGYELTGELTNLGSYRLHRGLRRADAAPVLIKAPRHEPARQTDIAALEREFAVLEGSPRDTTHLIALVRRNGHCALVFKDTGGVLLSHLLDSEPPDLAASLAISIHLAAALAELHQRDVVHGGLNPQSILVDPTSWRVQLIDFSNASHATAKSWALSEPDLSLRTLTYASPEQTGRMNRAVDYRTDLYSLGVILYELFTGRCPFESDDPLELAHAHIAKRPAVPSEIDPGIPPALDRLVSKLLAKTAEERYQSARGLRADLEYCAGQWRERCDIPAFAVGQHDFSDRFSVPEALYGRETQLDELLRAFEEICEGKSTLLLVAGYAGIGKTTLIQELYKPLVRSRGYFVSGKFDQFERDIPYRALIQAFEQLIQRLLAEGEARLEGWRAALTNALGANGGVLAEVLPEIELILGKQPPPPPVAPTEAQNRFQMVLQNFVGALAQPEHPLVIFLDDLQWVDSATLRLLKPLLTSPHIRSLFLIGAYRDNEVGNGHPLVTTQAELRRSGISPLYINLSPLRLTDLTQLVCDSLKSEPAYAQPLARLLQRKTDANPFFVIQFLKTLNQEGFIAFDYDRGRWAYDTEAIAQAPITGNVVDLMSRKIRRLKPVTQRAVIIAASLGSRFDLDTLSVVSEQTPETTLLNLQQSLDEGLILALGEEAARPAYRFLHDRVQQAAYALIPEIERPELHLKIGRLLLQQCEGSNVEDRVFEITGHLNTGAPLIHDQPERLVLVRLNLAAGRKAKSSAAWQAALGYLRSGIGLLTDEHWGVNYNLSFALGIEAAECEYLCGQFEAAERHFDELLARARSALDKARVYDLRLVQYENLSRYADAVRIGIEGLALLGISFPAEEDAIRVALEAEIRSIEKLVSGRSIESLVALPVMDDAEKRMAMRLLTDLWAPAYICGEGVPASLISARMVGLSIEYGNTADSAYGYVTHAITVGPSRGDYRSAYAWGTLALAVNERFDDRTCRAKIHQQFNAHVTLWRKPLQSCVIHAREACRAGMENGDFAYAGYGAFTESWPAFVLSRNLDRFVHDLEPNLELLLRIRTTGLAAAHSVMLNWARALLGRTEGARSLSSGDFQEAEFVRLHGDNPFFMTVYCVAKLHLAVLLEDQAGALELVRRVQRIGWGHGTIWPVLFKFWSALALTSVYPQAIPETQAVYEEELVATRNFLELLAENCPENYRCLFLVISAEMARIHDDAVPALELLEQAIRYARQTENLQQEALARELSGRLWLHRGNDAVAEVQLATACRLYRHWGAVTKVQQLEQRYPQLRLASREPNEPSLDIDSVTKAARAISSEIVLASFLRKLLDIVIENAGAQRGVLLQGEVGRLQVLAARDAEGAIAASPATSGAGSRVSEAIVNYVFRTSESVVAGDASADERFVDDAYIAEARPKSILCMPIIYQTRLTGCLYLENNLVTDAFTPSRLQVMQILAAQAAISLANAKLFEAMKHEVQQRRSAEEGLRAALNEVEQLKNRLQAEGAYLKEEIKLTHNFEEMVGSSRALRAVLRNVEVVAPTDATVLIQGETGTGKELIARAVHDRSGRRDRALVKVNCAAISAGLVESELFGHVKGAFTGALANRTGRFELAHGGTIFLDEIGELPPDTQVKLLRVLQEQEFEPVGSSRTMRVDVRVIAATNRDLETAVREGRFRADLYYRLNVFPIRLPPLRERREDIPQLVMFFLTRFAKKFGKRLDRVSQGSMERLVRYDWPGNIRDLQNVIERAAILSQAPTLKLDQQLPMTGDSATTAGAAPDPSNAGELGAMQSADSKLSFTLEEVERRHILETLRRTDGVIEGAKGAASLLNLRPSTLRARMKKLGISRSAREG